MGNYSRVTQMDVVITNPAASAKIIRSEYVVRDDLSDIDTINEIAVDTLYRVTLLEDGTLKVEEPYDEIKGGDGSEWLKYIAKYVKDGSYIEAISDSNDIVYRVVFHEGMYTKVFPIWPNKEQVLEQISEEELWKFS
jgi:hypothetical protein